ncbi:hypothetical protein [Methylocystis sp. SC2]|uniref:hypothetical protein n=1 Tax=Methylocystis sp. (strain SC2) TaxID=187303 RepID=UPI00027AF0B4|nr:hypothetical protein [Methylocystis sp. SC2]CCJ05891.1 Conserved hypothetical protein [Methylocystis sp. SC2]
MFPARRFAASLPFAGAFFAVLLPLSSAQAQDSPCEASAEVAVLPSPAAPWTGAPLRILVATEKPLQGELSLIAPDGRIAAKSHMQRGGPPYVWFAEVASPAPGAWRAAFDTSSFACGTITKEIDVSARKPSSAHSAEGAVWRLHNSWDRSTENLYSAWIAKLFDAPLEAEQSWKTWHEVLRNPSRNVLFNHLGTNEDSLTLALKPDCADFVYFLRAYFAFKMGLPFAYSNCSRGAGGAPPRCNERFDVMHPQVTRPAPPPEQAIASAAAAPAPTPAAAPTNILQQLFSQPQQVQPGAPAAPAAAPAKPPAPKRPAGVAGYFRAVGDVVHSGSVRAPANSDKSDFYTIPLTQETLRPGTAYADPYGHVMMLVQRVPQTADAAGVFLAVDAEPDGTVTRKRFWRGNFLFANGPSLGSPGFKRFRPIVRENGGLRALTNAEIAKNPDYGDFSLEQSQFSAEEFYDRMDEVMSPEPLDPQRAMMAAITALEEQVKTRAVAVENGRKFQNGGRGEASMPDGPAIFATSGAWEDFSTPARDLRLLIAIDVVRGFPDRVARRSDRYAMPFGRGPAGVQAQLQSALAGELAARTFTYTRSDGSAWTLSLKDVMDRAADLEMGYNPNDCVELRWGASDGSAEAATCSRRAPAAQRAKMTDYRSWFRERHWPHA